MPLARSSGGTALQARHTETPTPRAALAGSRAVVAEPEPLEPAAVRPRLPGLIAAGLLVLGLLAGMDRSVRARAVALAARLQAQAGQWAAATRRRGVLLRQAWRAANGPALAPATRSLRVPTLTGTRAVETLRCLGDAVIATAPDGTITTLNDAAARLTGWSERDALDRPLAAVLQLVDETSRAVRALPAPAALDDVHPGRIAADTLLIRRDGREVAIAGTIAAVRARDGVVAGLVVTLQDVTETRCAERVRDTLLARERQARRDAEALCRRKDDFVAIVSHELRTPLTAIHGWTRLLQRGSLDAAAQMHALAVIERNTRAQTRLVDELVDMARAVHGQLHIEPRELDLDAVLGTAVEALRPSAEARSHQLTVHPGGGLRVHGDADRLQQVFCNLLANAIRFTSPGGRIDVLVSRVADHAEVRVRDNGAGICAEDLPHLFEPFRASRDGQGRRAGLGVGLALVRHLVELHGGSVGVRSGGPDAGTEFVVRLPALEASAALDEVATRAVLPAANDAIGIAVAPRLGGAVARPATGTEFA